MKGELLIPSRRHSPVPIPTCLIRAVWAGCYVLFLGQVSRQRELQFMHFADDWLLLHHRLLEQERWTQRCVFTTPLCFKGFCCLLLAGGEKNFPSPFPLFWAWGNFCVHPSDDSGAELKWGRLVPWGAILRQAGQLLSHSSSSHYKPVPAYPCARCALRLWMSGHVEKKNPN